MTAVYEDDNIEPIDFESENYIMFTTILLILLIPLLTALFFRLLNWIPAIAGIILKVFAAFIVLYLIAAGIFALVE